MVSSLCNLDFVKGRKEVMAGPYWSGSKSSDRYG